MFDWSSFVQRALPSFFQVYTLLPILTVYTFLVSGVVVWMKQRYAIITPYTRKIFHFLVFTAAVVLHLWHGLGGVMLLGGVVSLGVLYAVGRGAGYPLYECLARPRDRPHRTLFVLLPWFTTALGGVIANLWMPAYAHIAYWVAGWGDAIGEPVGEKWGRHRYRVPSLAGVKAERSLEGSAAVVCVSWFIYWCTLDLPVFSGWSLVGVSLGGALLIGGIEAVSTHGLDNLTIQVVAVGWVYLLTSVL